MAKDEFTVVLHLPIRIRKPAGGTLYNVWDPYMNVSGTGDTPHTALKDWFESNSTSNEDSNGGFFLDDGDFYDGTSVDGLIDDLLAQREDTNTTPKLVESHLPTLE